MTTLAAATVGALRRRVAGRIEDELRRAGGWGSASLDARLIVAHLLGRDPGSLPLADDEAIGEDLETRAMALAERRGRGEPVARIIGRKEFWGLEFLLSPDTLVPRPDTETVVAAALAHVDETANRDTALAILDLGTGSGAILCALLAELPRAHGVGIDRTAGAVTAARTNARRLGLAARTNFTVGDWGSSLKGGFDLILGNPPYVESSGLATLPVDVRAYDPHLALDGGEDGLDAYRAILADLDRLMAPAGRAFFEVGWGQAPKVAELAAEMNLAPAFHRDLAGIDRVVELARKPLAVNAKGGKQPKNLLGNTGRKG